MKNINKHKIILWVSFVPYVLLIAALIFVAFAGYAKTEIYMNEDGVTHTTNYTHYGFEAMSSWLLDVSLDWFPFASIVFLVCGAYQIVYFLHLRYLPHKDGEDEAVKLPISAKILLWISFMPYALLILYTVYSTFYGLNAAKSALSITSIFHILPICLTYQIVYLQRKSKIKKDD